MQETREIVEGATQDDDRLVEEFGDVLFSLVNVGRKLGIDSEEALRKCNQKFRNRFDFMETEIKGKSKNFDDYSLSELDRFWEASKKV